MVYWQKSEIPKPQIALFEIDLAVIYIRRQSRLQLEALGFKLSFTQKGKEIHEQIFIPNP